MIEGVVIEGSKGNDAMNACCRKPVIPWAKVPVVSVVRVPVVYYTTGTLTT